MGKIISLHIVARPRTGTKAQSLSKNLLCYGTCMLLLAALLTGVLAISVLFSLAHLF